MNSYIIFTKEKRIKILDTGKRNEGFALRVSYPKKDYNSKPITERKKQYNKEYYRRPEVIARRKIPEAKARKAAYDELYRKRPGYKERKRELRRRNYYKKKLENERNTIKGVRKNA